MPYFTPAVSQPTILIAQNRQPSGIGQTKPYTKEPLTAAARSWATDNFTNELIEPRKFSQAAQLLKSAGAGLEPRLGETWTLLEPAGKPVQDSLEGSGYNPKEVLSGRVRLLVGVDSAFAAWRKLPSPLGLADLLEKPVNDLVAKRKDELVQAAARVDDARKTMPKETSDAALHYGEITLEGEPLAAIEAFKAARDRLQSLREVLSEQAKDREVRPLELLSELPGLRPVLMKLLQP